MAPEEVIELAKKKDVKIVDFKRCDILGTWQRFADHEFLLKGGVFTKDFIESFIAMKKCEYSPVRFRPHPYEFCHYHDV